MKKHIAVLMIILLASDSLFACADSLMSKGNKSSYIAGTVQVLPISDRTLLNTELIVQTAFHLGTLTASELLRIPHKDLYKMFSAYDGEVFARELGFRLKDSGLYGRYGYGPYKFPSDFLKEMQSMHHVMRRPKIRDILIPQWFLDQDEKILKEELADILGMTFEDLDKQINSIEDRRKDKEDRKMKAFGVGVSIAAYYIVVLYFLFLHGSL